MSVDLTSKTIFGRVSLVLLDDCLVKLEHHQTQDRVRRFMFDAIESVIIWRRVPWVSVILCSLFLILPGLSVLLIGETFSTVTGGCLLSLGGALILWYLYAGRTTIRIVRAGKFDDIVGVFRPGKVRKLNDRLVVAVSLYQQDAMARAASAVDLPGSAVHPTIPDAGVAGLENFGPA